MVDAREYNSNSVRNRLAYEEGKSIEAVYSEVQPDTKALGHPVSTDINYGGIFYARESTNAVGSVYSALPKASVDKRYESDVGNAVFDDCTYISLCELCAMLLKKYKLTVNDLIRHYDVTGKNCPKYFVEHEDAWNQFKADVNNKIIAVQDSM